MLQETMVTISRLSRTCAYRMSGEHAALGAFAIRVSVADLSRNAMHIRSPVGSIMEPHGEFVRTLSFVGQIEFALRIELTPLRIASLCGVSTIVELVVTKTSFWTSRPVIERIPMV